MRRCCFRPCVVARNSAKRIACANNLKQLYFGVLEYVDDYNGWLPATRHSTLENPPEAPFYLGRLLKDYLNIPYQSVKASVYICPNDKNVAPATAHTMWAWISYGANYENLINAVPYRPKYKLSTVRHPSESSYMIDTLLGNTWYFSGNYLAGDWGPVNTWDLRHNNGLNVLYVDGHFEYVPLRSIPTSGTDVMFDWSKP